MVQMTIENCKWFRWHKNISPVSDPQLDHASSSLSSANSAKPLVWYWWMMSLSQSSAALHRAANLARLAPHLQFLHGSRRLSLGLRRHGPSLLPTTNPNTHTHSLSKPIFGLRCFPGLRRLRLCWSRGPGRRCTIYTPGPATGGCRLGLSLTPAGSDPPPIKAPTRSVDRCGCVRHHTGRALSPSMGKRRPSWANWARPTR